MLSPVKYRGLHKSFIDLTLNGGYKMIPKEQIQIALLAHVLENCGHADASKIINIANSIENKRIKVNGKEKFLFYVDKEGDVPAMIVEQAESWVISNQRFSVNDLIHAAYDIIIGQISELFNVTLEEGSDYQVIVDGVASSLSVLNDELPEEVKQAIESF
jgi:hypothetical protein